MTDHGIPSRYAEAHKTPNGAGDARPTALQILKDNELLGNLHGKTILVTGGTDGLGLETVRTLAKTGATVFFTARNASKAEKVLQDIKSDADANLKGAKIDWIQIDNTSLASVKKGAEDFLKKSDQLNVLITNAGTANTPETRTADGFELQFGVNHLAHFYLFQLLKPVLLHSATSSSHSRVVAVSSTAHGFATVQIGNYNFEKPLTESVDPMTELEGEGYYNPMVAYGQSKTANIWFANEIERRYGAEKLHGLSIHPGNIVTAGWGNLDPRVVEKFKPFMEMEAFQKGFKSVEQGAATQVWAAVGKDLEGKGGLYLDDCSVSSPLPDEAMVGLGGYRAWAFNEAGAKQLWADSLEMVGVKES